MQNRSYKKERLNMGREFDRHAFRKRREQLNIALGEFASLIGAHPSTVGGWETGRSSPAADFMPKINKILQTNFKVAKKKFDYKNPPYFAWTLGSRHCYESNQDCERCDAYPVMKDSTTPCRMPESVKSLLQNVGKPPAIIDKQSRPPETPEERMARLERTKEERERRNAQERLKRKMEKERLKSILS